MSPVAATGKATTKQPAHPKKQKLLGSMSATNAHSQPCNARSSRTVKEKRSRARFRLSLAAPLRRTASLMPFRRPPTASRCQRQTEAHGRHCPIQLQQYRSVRLSVQIQIVTGVGRAVLILWLWRGQLGITNRQINMRTKHLKLWNVANRLFCPNDLPML